MRKILISILLIFSWLVIAQPVMAQRTPPLNNPPNNVPANTPPSTTSDPCEKLRQQFENANGGAVINALPQYCQTSGVIYNKIVRALYWLVGIVAVIVIIYGGYLYMTSAGNAVQTQKARTVLTWAIIGLIVVILAALIVNIVVRGLVEGI